MQAVYHRGQCVVPEEFARQDPASVPAVIAAWVKAVQGSEQAQHTQQALLDLLNTRPGHTQPKSAQVPLLPVDIVQTATALPFHSVIHCSLVDELRHFQLDTLEVVLSFVSILAYLACTHKFCTHAWLLRHAIAAC